MTIREEIEQLKKEKNAVILAHYYVRPEVQEIADYVGDSFYLSKVAVGLKEKTIVFCGVSFMGESAKILNPEKTVLMPDMAADCPMAHMASAETIEKIRSEYDDLAVVCYINSTAELKRHSDVCVTSSCMKPQVFHDFSELLSISITCFFFHYTLIFRNII